MKKLLLIAFSLLVLTTVQAQTPAGEEETQYAYCVIYPSATLFANKSTVHMDFGQRPMDKLKDDDNNEIKITSMVRALNLMGKRGWVLMEIYEENDRREFLFRKKTEYLTEDERKSYDKAMDFSR